MTSANRKDNYKKPSPVIDDFVLSNYIFLKGGAAFHDSDIKEFIYESRKAYWNEILEKVKKLPEYKSGNALENSEFLYFYNSMGDIVKPKGAYYGINIEYMPSEIYAVLYSEHRSVIGPLFSLSNKDSRYLNPMIDYFYSHIEEINKDYQERNLSTKFLTSKFFKIVNLIKIQSSKIESELRRKFHEINNIHIDYFPSSERTYLTVHLKASKAANVILKYSYSKYSAFASDIEKITEKIQKSIEINK